MSYTLLSESNHVARKEHRCIWCGEKIVVGEKYRSERSIYDGDFQYHKWHLECNVAFLAEIAGCGECEFHTGEGERPKERLGFDKGGADE